MEVKFDHLSACLACMTRDWSGNVGYKYVHVYFFGAATHHYQCRLPPDSWMHSKACVKFNLPCRRNSSSLRRSPINMPLSQWRNIAHMSNVARMQSELLHNSCGCGRTLQRQPLSAYLTGAAREEHRVSWG